jgi:hypothetical protein
MTRQSMGKIATFLLIAELIFSLLSMSIGRVNIQLIQLWLQLKGIVVQMVTLGKM